MRKVFGDAFFILCNVSFFSGVEKYMNGFIVPSSDPQIRLNHMKKNIHKEEKAHEMTGP